jgi:hypothetical protein
VYKHFATLYFIFVIDSSESELGMLDLIQGRALPLLLPLLLAMLLFPFGKFVDGLKFRKEEATIVFDRSLIFFFADLLKSHLFGSGLFWQYL